MRKLFPFCHKAQRGFGRGNAKAAAARAAAASSEGIATEPGEDRGSLAPRGPIRAHVEGGGRAAPVFPRALDLDKREESKVNRIFENRRNLFFHSNLQDLQSHSRRSVAFSDDSGVFSSQAWQAPRVKRRTEGASLGSDRAAARHGPATTRRF